MARRTKLIILSVVIVLLGFLRDYFFYNINWILKTLTENRPNQALPEFHFLLDWSISKIVITKWILTILFFSIFGTLTFLIIKIGFRSKLCNRITLLVFAGLFCISGLLFVLYKALGSPMNIYAIIRTLMGLGQSFVPLILLSITFKFFPLSSKIDQEC